MSTQSITTRVRKMLRDTGEYFASESVADGNTAIFDVDYEFVSTLTPPVVAVGNATVPPTAYSFDSVNGTIRFNTPPLSNATVTISGTHYNLFDDVDVAQFVADGFALHVTDEDPLPVLDPVPGQVTIPAVEEYLVALLALAEACDYALMEAATSEDVDLPDGVAIPRSQVFRQLMEAKPVYEKSYRDRAQALGVGLWRIQVVNQRRLSLTTNRLVPIFKEMEFNAPYSGFFPTSGPVGTLVTITGWNLSSASQVTFGGVPAAAVTFVGDTQLLAVVPPGAQTGQIGVTTPGGVVLSTAAFVVGQPMPEIAYGPQLVQPAIPPGT